MNIGQGYHLTYCTNIHPGETWAEVFESLKTYVLPIKAHLSPDKPFGIGLRLSDRASKDIITQNYLAEFKFWLQQNGLYIFTMNGFPFGGFHGQVVKDAVHHPDWTTEARLEYTQRLSRILAELLPEGMDGGISTSPLSYKPWLGNDPAHTEEILEQATTHMARLVESLYQLQQETGKTIHIDIEPEPDGLLENAAEFLNYYKSWLLPVTIDYLGTQLGLSADQAEKITKTHIQLCYDVCHFALAYEEPQTVLQQLAEAGIQVGKIQISAALKAQFSGDSEEREEIKQAFQPFVESTYLHQVLVKNADGSIVQYPDLPPALEHIQDAEATEWRTHFHVPIFVDRFNRLQSTQDEIIKTLQLLPDNPVTKHLEVETYTWGVLPGELKQDLGASIERELSWVLAQWPE
ncbi:metabolite traffic protein EboE [Adhaeribacter radiodurans]|uniref:Metabolite traffic protein EboE n=1 Tax=Adhaeribacter radiodurans TaxID=2745197 RepID=A0A7L7LEN1_9BACT|nr:metabolite traffic protein EboE [Adhaeribacter radiodurans]QMU31280.1 metabolite traffic protein EboE [Adhaeribacter radiodurans]